MGGYNLVKGTPETDVLNVSCLEKGEQSSQLVHPYNFYKELVKFAIYFAASLLPVVWGLDDLSRMLQDLFSNFTVPHPYDSEKESISLNASRVLVVILFISIFSTYWFGRNFIQARKTIRDLTKRLTQYSGPESCLAEISASLVEKDQQIKRFFNKIDQQRSILSVCPGTF